MTMVGEEDIKWFLSIAGKEYHDDSLYEQPGNTAFRALIEGVGKALENNYDPYEDYFEDCGVTRDLYKFVYVPIIKNLIEANKETSKELEEHMRYGTKITLTNEAFEKIINEQSVEVTVQKCKVDGIEVDCVEIFPDGLTLDEDKFKAGDKVRVLVIKENENE